MTLTETLSQPRRITVPLGEHPSEIWIGAGLAENLQSLLDTAGFGQRRFLVSNPTIWKYHGEAIQHVCGNEEVILIPDGERHKTVKTVSHIYEALIRNEADRASSIVAVGGGAKSSRHMGAYGTNTIWTGPPLQSRSVITSIA